MTPEEELDARNKAFYLLKKYTSFTFLNEARSMYQKFLNAYEKQLDMPGIGTPEFFAKGYNDRAFYIERYKGLLQQLMPIEEGLKMLRTKPHKREAYQLIMSSRFDSEIWGRGPREWMLEDDPYYWALGYGKDRTPHTSYIKDVWAAVICFSALAWVTRTEKLYKRGTTRAQPFECCTYESLFHPNEGLIFGWPDHPRHYPPHVDPCPPHREDDIYDDDDKNADQVLSQREIHTTGIWEPWFLPGTFPGKPRHTPNGQVGCPNYFLAGDIAPEYQLEGTDQLEAVFWRLLWKDNRYQDGTIPSEEARYFEPNYTPANTRIAPRALAGEICPETGTWFTNALLNTRKIYVKAGDRMPAQEFDRANNWVVWYLKLED